jgi:hypothetical protein
MLGSDPVKGGRSVPGFDREDRGAVHPASSPGPRADADASRGDLVDADEGGLPGGDGDRTVCGTGEPAKWWKVKS